LFSLGVDARNAPGSVHADGYNIAEPTGARVGKGAHLDLQASPAKPAVPRERSAVPGRVRINRVMIAECRFAPTSGHSVAAQACPELLVADSANLLEHDPLAAPS